ncbi:hypothetical protein HQ545_08875 [Candidatus Woesearchaeota archaeon]|nr:hypothetical protein [Candidatus Woesearchaeota archaeon]
MFIKDLQARQTNVDVEGEVLELSDVREFSKFGKQGKVASAIIKDGTGKVKLSLWNEQIEKVKVGDKVKIANGYVSEFQGELQLTTGKFGSMEIMGEGDAQETAPEPSSEPTPTAKEPTTPEPVSEPTQTAEEPAPETPEPVPKTDSEPAEEKKQPVSESLDVEEEDLS